AFAWLGAHSSARAELIYMGSHFGLNDEDDPDMTDIRYVDYFIDDVTFKIWWEIHDKDGSVTKVEVGGNPNPDDPSSGPKDGDMQTVLAKLHGGGKFIPDKNFWNSPLGRKLGSAGKGPGPAINPSDEETGGGQGDPSLGKEKLGKPQIYNDVAHVG